MYYIPYGAEIRSPMATTSTSSQCVPGDPGWKGLAWVHGLWAAALRHMGLVLPLIVYVYVAWSCQLYYLLRCILKPT